MSKLAAQAEQLPVDPVLAASCFEFLLIEIVPLAQRMVERLHARERALRDEYKRSQLFHKVLPVRETTTTAAAAAAGELPVPGLTPQDGMDATPSVPNTTADTNTNTDTTTLAGVVDDEIRETLFWKLDQMGYRVGQGLVERFSVNKPRPQAPLDAIKFVCKDLWILLFKKQIDNLKTNHRGVFVLTDSRFQPLARMSVDRKHGHKAVEEANRRAQAFLYFPCGIIRGALSGLGIDVTVNADTTELPVATFHLKMKTAKP